MSDVWLFQFFCLNLQPMGCNVLFMACSRRYLGMNRTFLLYIIFTELIFIISPVFIIFQEVLIQFILLPELLI